MVHDLIDSAGIRPREWDEIRKTETERHMREAQLQQETVDKVIAAHGGVLNTGPFPFSPSQPSGTEYLARTVAALTLELEHLLHHTGLLGNAVASLMDAKAQFSDEDVALIKAHVRHPGAIEAARLRETIRCTLVALKAGAVSAAQDILEELDAK